MFSLYGKTIVLGVTGSVAAYKAADIASRLTQAGAKVQVVMTEAAQKFVTPMTFRAVTRQPVVTSIWDMASEFSVAHVSLAAAADVILIAPATANTIAKLAHGLADDILTSTVLASRAPVIVAPAMNDKMYANPATRENMASLKARGFTFIDCEDGHLACGTDGRGRLANIQTIIAVVADVIHIKDDLAGKTLVVTAGGTREPIDPVRFIGNRSSGKMGYRLAVAARGRGAMVRLISTVAFADTAGMELVRVETAEEMKAAVEIAVTGANALIMAAAVADFRPAVAAKHKVKKESAFLCLELELTPDILVEVKGNFIRVGFAAETRDLVKNAQKKLTEKNLDLVVANDVTAAGSGFGADTNKVTLLFRDGHIDDLPMMSKQEVAEKILDAVAVSLK